MTGQHQSPIIAEKELQKMKNLPQTLFLFKNHLKIPRPTKNQQFHLCDGEQTTGTMGPKKEYIKMDLETRMKEIFGKLQKNTKTKTVGTFARLELRSHIFRCSTFL